MTRARCSSTPRATTCRNTALDERAHEARERALLEADVVLEVRDVRKRRMAAARARRRAASRRWRISPAPTPRAPRTSSLVSNVTGAGLAGLRDRIAEALAARRRDRPDRFSSRVRQAEHVDARARRRSSAPRPSCSGGPLELAASDLRVALRELRAIRGAEGGDPVLDRIFSEFCIGK